MALMNCTFVSRSNGIRALMRPRDVVDNECPNLKNSSGKKNVVSPNTGKLMSLCSLYLLHTQKHLKGRYIFFV